MAEGSAPPVPWVPIGLGIALVGAVTAAQLAPRSGSAVERGGDVIDLVEASEPSREDPGAEPLGEVEQLRVRVVERYPHDPEAFTQGLLWHGGELYESTGLRRRSSVRRVRLRDGEVLAERTLEPRYFGEGLSLVGDHLVQLTWTSGRALVWSLDGFQLQRTFDYGGEGWGLCHDGTRLIMSNGSSRLSFRDPATFRETRSVRVTLDGQPLRALNELECVEGVVWANVWRSDRIVRIDPSTGRVTGSVEAAGLLTEEETWGADVLNGIAWVPERGRFLITGKNWPWLFEVVFEPAG